MKTALRGRHNWHIALFAAALAACGLPAVAQAAEFGALRVLSSPGSPFVAEVEMRLQPGEADTILVRSAAPRVYAGAGLPYGDIAADLRIRLRARDGRHYGLLTSSLVPTGRSVPLLLEASTASGTISRQYDAPLPSGGQEAEVPSAGAGVSTFPVAPPPPAAVAAAGASRTVEPAPIASPNVSLEAKRESAAVPAAAVSTPTPAQVAGTVGRAADGAAGTSTREAQTVASSPDARSELPASISDASSSVEKNTVSGPDRSPPVRAEDRPLPGNGAPVHVQPAPTSPVRRIASVVKVESEPDVSKGTTVASSSAAPTSVTASGESAAPRAAVTAPSAAAIQVPAPLVAKVPRPSVEAPVVTSETPAVVPIESKASRSAYGQIAETGVRPADTEIPRVSGHGARMPLGKALGMIVPQGWRGFTSDSAVKSAGAVDWDAQDVPWPTILGEILASRQISATINWDRKEIEFASIVPVDMVDGATASRAAGGKPQPEAPLVMRTPTIASAAGDRSSAGRATATKVDEAAVIAGLRRVKIDGLGSGAGEKTVSSLGVNVNLMTAISQVAPEGWLVIARERKLSETTVVGWNGRDRSWLTVLDELLARTKLVATVNAERHEIELFAAAQ